MTGTVATSAEDEIPAASYIVLLSDAIPCDGQMRENTGTLTGRLGRRHKGCTVYGRQDNNLRGSGVKF